MGSLFRLSISFSVMFEEEVFVLNSGIDNLCNVCYKCIKLISTLGREEVCCQLITGIPDPFMNK